jgi:hypothetical protein
MASAARKIAYDRLAQRLLRYGGPLEFCGFTVPLPLMVEDTLLHLARHKHEMTPDALEGIYDWLNHEFRLQNNRWVAAELRLLEPKAMPQSELSGKSESKTDAECGKSESEKFSRGEQQPEARSLLDRLPAEIRDNLIDEERALLPWIEENERLTSPKRLSEFCARFGLPVPSLRVQDPPSSELPKKAEPLPPKPEPVEQSKEQTGTELALASVAPKPKQSRKRGVYNSQIRNCARKVVEQAYGDARPVKGEAKEPAVKKKLTDTYQKMVTAKLLPSTGKEPSWSTYERELGWRDVEK